MMLTFVLICSCDYFQLVLIVRHLIERWSILVIIAGVLNFKMATSYFFSDTKEEINMIKKLSSKVYYTKDAYTKYGVTLLKTNFKISRNLHTYILYLFQKQMITIIYK